MAVLDYSKFEYLTFDCYGTLIDWESGIVAALRPLLKEHGVDLPDEDVLSLYAELESSIETEEFMPYKGVLREVVKKAGVKFGFIPDDKDVNLLVHSIGYWKPFDDTVPALRELSSRFKLAVISNIDDDLFRITQSKLGIEFDGLVTAEQVRAYKPDLAVFRTAIEKLGVAKESILHVAQSLYHDISPANELGIKTVWVNRRHGRDGYGATPMASADPDVEVPDLASLVRLILEN